MGIASGLQDRHGQAASGMESPECAMWRRCVGQIGDRDDPSRCPQLTDTDEQLSADVVEAATGLGLFVAFDGRE